MISDALTTAPAHVPSDRVHDFDIYAVGFGGGDYFEDWRALQGAGKPGMIWSRRHGGHWIVTRGSEIHRLIGDQYPGASAARVQPSPKTPAPIDRDAKLDLLRPAADNAPASEPTAMMEESRPKARASECNTFTAIVESPGQEQKLRGKLRAHHNTQRGRIVMGKWREHEPVLSDALHPRSDVGHQRAGDP